MFLYSVIHDSGTGRFSRAANVAKKSVRQTVSPDIDPFVTVQGIAEDLQIGGGFGLEVGGCGC